jgi:hypothetical protein
MARKRDPKKKPEKAVSKGSDPNGGSRAPKSLMTNHLPLSLIELLRRCSRWSVLGVEYWSGKKASSA